MLLSALTGDDNDVDVAFEKIVPKFTNEKSFDSKLFYEHVSTKLRLGVLRLKHPRLTSAEARSVLLPLLHRYPSNPVLLDTLLTKTDLRPSVADQLWRKSVQVFFLKRRINVRYLTMRLLSVMAKAFVSLAVIAEHQSKIKINAF